MSDPWKQQSTIFWVSEDVIVVVIMLQHQNHVNHLLMLVMNLAKGIKSLNLLKKISVPS